MAVPPIAAAAETTAQFTILHTNDFHGQLIADGSNPGLARVATVVNGVRSDVGAGNVLLVDAGDEMQGSLLSNLQKGAPTIAGFNAVGTNVATFGNHEFDWGQTNLGDRTAQATYPFVTANIVKNDTGNCATAGWETPDFAEAPYSVQTANGVKVAFIGVTTTETPTITVSTATAGLCFKDPAESILHYYDAMKSAADVIVVLSHLGFNDGGYGYGIPVYGDQTLADKLFKAGKPVPLIIGGHSHTNVTMPAPVIDGVTTVAQAYYNGRQVGRADLTFDSGSKAVSVAWSKISVIPPGAKDSAGNPLTPTAEDPVVKAIIDGYANDPAYLNLVNQPIGYSAVDLPRNGGKADNMMGTFIDDAIYGYLNTDTEPANDVDIFFNNAGGIRTDWCWDSVNVKWSNSGCTDGTHDPALLTYGNMFTVLPFGNATVVGTMTGADILQVLNQGPLVSNGVIQPAGLKYTYYAYRKVDPNSTADPPAKRTYAWGATDYCVVNKTTKACDPLDLTKTYKVGTNEFLAPAGGDSYGGFKYMKNITYWGDMLNAVDAYVSANYGSAATAYKGPNADGTLDARIVRDGDDTTGSVIPITILHNNDSHGNLAKGKYVGYTQLATLIQQERYYNPDRTLLLNAGDQIQGDAMMYYFKSSYTGKASNGDILPVSLRTNPMMAVMNALGYDAMTLGNHEFNFGSDVFKGVLGQATFPILGANVSDTGAYGLAAADGGQGVKPYIEFNLDGIKVAVLGITNHRVPNYELPSNIAGLTFSDPIAAGDKYAPALSEKGDVVVALTHIGFTEDPKSVEVDKNVDTNFAAEVPGVDAIIGGHSHTNPVYGFGDYKFLPTIVAGPNGEPVIINQAYRYNNYLGEVVLGVLPKYSLTITDVNNLYASKAIDNAGTKNALLSKLAAVKASFDADHVATALSQLKAFVNYVSAQSGKHITKAAAAALIADANWMITNKAMYRTVSSAGQYLAVTSTTPEDPAIKAIVDPYAAVLNDYNTKVVGKTTAPIDTRLAFTEETNGANLQADASVWELASKGITDVDVHLSGAMTNNLMAGGATVASPVTLTVSDMFAGMPYENSLVVLKMNGPQIKAVLERAYRNYYYYKYVLPGHGGYSYYTTCMIDTNSVGQITYDDTSPTLPSGNNVVSLTINGVPVDFADATKYYNVSTVNYLAAGSCNFNDNGKSLWPLDQIVHDTQYYVRDAVIDYIAHEQIVSPAIEGRLVFK
ncbi:MAG: bifunctional metallophosphatase/5'-nucleotidase [Candidatus Limnocylindrales bacterium]